MHTVIVIAVGLGVLGLCALAGHALGGLQGTATAALVFLPVWFFGAAGNMYLGVKRAGYSVADEAPIFLLVYAIPSAAALLLWWRLR
jgi:hypothetical protein